MKSVTLLLVTLLAISLATDGRADPSLSLKPSDVVALIGGEDMVALSDSGYLEFILQRARPDLRLKFRCLAWEGDTVFQQPRMLNYPNIEQQLEEIGATVVLVQVGSTNFSPEKLEGAANHFFDRCERAQGNVKRRIVVVFPSPTEAQFALGSRNDILESAQQSTSVILAQIVQVRRCRSVMLTPGFAHSSISGFTRDGVHLNDRGLAFAARLIAAELLHRDTDIRDDGTYAPADATLTKSAIKEQASEAPLRLLITQKNRLWERYRRPQNWAFLAGDRISQPSSRDHRDPAKRWFPEEMKEFLPLIEVKEREIWETAAKLTADKQ